MADKTCTECGFKGCYVKRVQEKEILMMPFAAHEEYIICNRIEKKRLWVSLICTTALLLVSNALWLFAFMR